MQTDVNPPESGLFAPILAAYERTRAATQDAWAANPRTGDPLPPEPHRAQLGISSGRIFAASGPLAQVHAELRALAAQDPLLDVTPANSLHFTFLALAWDRYTLQTLPPELAALKPIFAKHTLGMDFAVTDLRLLPLKNALVLAGLPSPDSFARRNALAQELLASAWGPLLQGRYRGFDIPPLFWHTTLARYGAPFASQPLRDVYARHSAIGMGGLHFGQPLLAAVNYNWQQCHPL